MQYCITSISAEIVKVKVKKSLQNLLYIYIYIYNSHLDMKMYENELKYDDNMQAK